MANCLWDTWTCHSLSNIDCANASSNISKHQPAGKRLKSTSASTLHAMFSYVQTSNKLGTRAQSASLQRQEHFKWQSLACWFFICTNLKQTLFKPQIYGAGPCQQVRQDFQGKFNLILFFARDNCDFLRCLELRFDWGLYIWKHSRSRVWSWHGFLQLKEIQCWRP